MNKICICGSINFLDEMIDIKNQLEKLNFEVFIPDSKEKLDPNLEISDLKIKYDVIKNHYKKILESDAILVFNPEKKSLNGYIGGNSFLEMGFAYVNNKDIFITNPIPELSYTDEIRAFEPKLIKSVNDIWEYFNNKNNIFIATQSDLKIRALKKSLNDLNLKNKVFGYKTNSNVSDQPIGFYEIYNGALNRLNDLRSKVDGDYDYLVSVESGNIKFHENYGYFDFSICLVEDKYGKINIGLESSFPIPDELFNQIPQHYPDLGVLVQQKYGIKDKDPMLYLSNNKLNREDLLKFAIKNALVQFK